MNPIVVQDEGDRGQLLQVISSENLVATDSTLGIGNVWHVYESPTLEERMQELEMGLEHQRQRLMESEENYSKDVLVFAKDCIITVACEILLNYFGNQLQKSSSVQDSLKTDDGQKKMKQFLNLSQSNLSNEKFAQDADRIIDQSNIKVALIGSLQELDANVKEVYDLFERHPCLKIKFKSEWVVIHNYEHLKKVYIFRFYNK